MSRIDLPKIYNPATQTSQELIENFVVRTEMFHDIFDDIKQSDMSHPEQHYIIQGIRGQGKTTLLLRIAYEIERDAELSKRFVPIVFNEEQYNISRLFKLWETVAEYLDDMGEIKGLYDEMQQFEHEADFEERCFHILEKALKKHQKKLILFIDNIDELLIKFSRQEHQRLREVFQESAELRIIGASSVSLEFHYDYGKPFYQFFRMPQLRGLNAEETKTLLLKLGEYYKTERVQEIVAQQPGRIEALRRLTGGVIRTIILLYEIFVDDTNGNAFRDLEKILDNVTPLYKHRMDKLSAQQQEIIDFIALNWDAVSAKEIAQKTKLESKAVSAQLKQLEKYHIIEKERTNTKNYLYRIYERFFNIWYLMRLGRKWDARRVRFLVEFLQIWCDEAELEKRARKQLAALKQNRLHDQHALFMTEALARTPLKRELQHELISETRTYLEKKYSEFKNYLCTSDSELEKAADKAYEAGDFETAIQNIEQIKIKSPDDYNTLGILFEIYKKDFKQAEQYYLLAVANAHANAMYNLALLYETEFNNFPKAEQYYLLAIAKGDSDAMNNLAALYQTEYKDFPKAEQYYLLASAKENTSAMYNLAALYQTEYKDFPKAEQYYLLAVEKGDADAMNNLAALYQTEYKDFPKAEQYYLMAVGKELPEAMFALAGLYYDEFKNIKKAEKYYLMAVEKEDPDAMIQLGGLYYKEFKNIKKAEKYFLMAIKKENADAMYILALLYKTEFKDFQKAEQHYLLAVAKDHANAMNNLAGLYHEEFKDFQKAEQYYLMAVAKDHANAMNNLAALYQTEFKDFQKAEQYYLMAVEKEHVDAMYNLAQLYKTEFKDLQKAEQYFLMAVDKDDSNAMNELAWIYFEKKINKQKAAEYAKRSYEKKKSIYNSHTYSMVLLWDNQIETAYNIAQEFLINQEVLDGFSEDVSLFLLLLTAKKQYHLTSKLFNENPHHLKDRFKPIYYALMYFMQNEFPNEYRKMGGELKQTVEEIIEKIGQLEKDYR